MTRPVNNQEQVLYLLNTLGNQMSPKFERCTGISSSRLEILHEICQVEEINQSMLQKLINIDSAAITRHLKQLEAEGMIVRSKKPDDQRVTFVQLSEHGRERIAAFRKEKEVFLGQLLHDFTEEEVSQLADYLQRMQNNI